MPGIGIGIAPHEILQTMSVGPPPFRFDVGLQAFTAYMAKRAGQGPFAAAPIVQGDWDGSGVPDVLTFPRGNLIGNQTQIEYANFDPYQGAAVFWITPEWDGNDGILHFLYGGDSDPINIYKRADDLLIIRYETTILVSTNVAAWTAGTTYCVVMRWDSLNTLDGTNYGCTSINDVHDFEGTSSWVAVAPPATQYIGSYGGATNAADSILEGLTIYRRPLFDGTYGVRPQNGNQYSADEINAIYNAGAGRDPTLVTGSEDVCFCLPTDSAQEILATGTGEAWSWPWENNLPDVWGAWDGGLPGTDRAVEFNGTTTVINCGSDVDIDDIHDAEFTAEAWIRADGWGENNLGSIYGKGVYGTSGWRGFISDGGYLSGFVECATTDAYSAVEIPDFVDGKWHHVVMYFNDAGDRKVYFAIDGVWVSYVAQTAGVGAIISDAAQDLLIGVNSTGSYTFDGAFAWVAISNNDRHSHGTDFIPPRAFPADDANYLASWPMDEGTGVAIDNIGNQGGAGSGAANRDGTLANGAWSSIWEQDATPVIPQSVEFDGTVTLINCGSGATIDDIPAAGAIVSAECWFRLDADASGVHMLISKSASGAAGWGLSINSDGTVRASVDLATADCVADGPATSLVRDGRWHHAFFTYNDTTKSCRTAVDGIWGAASGGVGAYVTDVALDLYIGRLSTGASWFFDGGVGWVRVSDIARYTPGTDFVPEARSNMPGVDGNTMLQIDMTDGAGTTATDSSGNANHGTITFGAGLWRNTPDMEIDEPGAAIYGPKGYNLGVDAALEGMYIEQVVIAETDYVVFPVLSIGESGRARPRIRIRDVSNAADVVIFNGPMLYGTHTGGNNSPDLIPTNPRWIADALIDGAVYNITDGSAAPIPDNNEDIVTAGLGGGVDNDWDNGDIFVIRMPYGYCERPWMESFCFTVPAGCILLRIFIENVNAEGVMQIHQVQVEENLLTEGSMEAGAGNPWIPTGWANVDLDLGDSTTEAVIVHSGSQSMEFAVGASAEGIRQQITAAIDDFITVSLWSYGDGSAGFTIGGLDATQLRLQHSSTLYNIATPHTAEWSLTVATFRVVATNPSIYILADSGAAGLRYIDDVKVF